MGVQVDPLFVGATRPATIAGISYEAMVAIVLLVAVPYVLTSNFLILAAGIPAYSIAYLICRKDPRAFRLIFMWLATKATGRNRGIWRCTSQSPLSYRKR